MYEAYFGFTEKPFSLTPDPKYLFRSQSHANAFELLKYAIGRREGFVLVTGDIGTGKTTLCRALLEQIDRTTFTALVLNPFLSEEDLLKRILQDFGIVTRESIKAGRLAGATKQELIETLYDFLLGLVPLNANAVLIVDEAQNLPLSVLEQIRILSNLETDKEKLLQIVLVGQLNLGKLLRSPGLTQLDQRISIRHQLEPLDRETVGAYVAHRLTIAGGSAAVTFAPKALDLLHRLSGGVPRVINLLCDRALLAAFSVRENRITRDMVAHAAASLEVQTAAFGSRPLSRHGGASLAAATVVALAASMLGVGTTAYLYKRFAVDPVQAATIDAEPLSAPLGASRPLPGSASLTILVGSYPATSDFEHNVRALTRWLEIAGFEVYYARRDEGPKGRWLHLLAGAYTDLQVAQREAGRLNRAVPGAGARVISAAAASVRGN